MDGKLLVLCDEDVTLDEYGNRIGEDEHKDIISCLELTLPYETANICNRDIFFVDWKTFMPNDLNFLRFLKEVAYAKEKEKNVQRGLLKASQQESLMEKVYINTLLEKCRGIDFSHVGINDFFNEFTDMLDKNRILRILPCYSEKISDIYKGNRKRILYTWNDRNITFLNANGNSITKAVNTSVLPDVNYNDFGEIYGRAKDEMLKIRNIPDFASVGDDDGQR